MQKPQLIYDGSYFKKLCKYNFSRMQKYFSFIRQSMRFRRTIYRRRCNLRAAVRGNVHSNMNRVVRCIVFSRIEGVDLSYF